MYKYILLTFVLVIPLYSCSLQDDNDGLLISQDIYNSSKVYSIEEDFVEIDFHLCSTYDSSILQWDNFVVFKKINLYSYYGDDAYNPPLIGSYKTGIYSQRHCPNSMWDYGASFKVRIPKKYEIIENESWLMTVDIDVNPFLNDGNYRITLYDAYQEDFPMELASIICESAQYGNSFTIPMSLLTNEYTGQRDFYLQLYVSSL